MTILSHSIWTKPEFMSQPKRTRPGSRQDEPKKTRQGKNYHDTCFQIFFVISEMKGVLGFLFWIINLLFQKIVGAGLLLASIWVASASFEWCLQWHMVAKPALPSCYWRHHHVLFLLVWCVEADNKWFVVGDRFSFSFLSLSYRKNSYLFVFFYFNLNSHVFYFFISTLALFIICFMFSI